MTASKSTAEAIASLVGVWLYRGHTPTGCHAPLNVPLLLSYKSQQPRDLLTVHSIRKKTTPTYLCVRPIGEVIAEALGALGER